MATLIAHWLERRFGRSDEGEREKVTKAEEPEENPLESSVRRSRALLAFAASNGIAFESTTVAAIVKCQSRSPEAGPLSPEDEAAFWNAFGRLTHLAAPVTAESLEETNAALKKGFFRSAATRGIAWLTVIVIFVTLACQIYWAVYASRIAAYNAAATQWTHVIDPASKPSEAAIDDAKTARQAAAEGLQQVLGNRVCEKSLDEVCQKLLLQNVQNIADNLYKLILPALYGLLGSIIYALRTISQQIQQYSYTWGTRVAGIGRMLLGPVMGFASLVLVPNLPNSPTLKDLPPLAIALVAGYSVDLIFSLMDRIVRAFQPDSPTRPQTPARAPA
jgi:hypothetical protein